MRVGALASRGGQETRPCEWRAAAAYHGLMRLDQPGGWLVAGGKQRPFGSGARRLDFRSPFRGPTTLYVTGSLCILDCHRDELEAKRRDQKAAAISSPTWWISAGTWNATTANVCTTARNSRKNRRLEHCRTGRQGRQDLGRRNAAQIRRRRQRAPLRDRCAGAMWADNQTKSPHERIEFRIGINLGDIIVDWADTAGDGVNVAARLERWPNRAGFAFRPPCAGRFTAVLWASTTSASSRSRTSCGRPRVGQPRLILPRALQVGRFSHPGEHLLLQRGLF